jgi:chromosome segregation ATPase
VAHADLLRDVLELAGKEKSLEGEGLEAFAAALRERAALVVAERLARLEAAVLASETQVRTLEGELTWRREVAKGLEESVHSLQTENAWLRETVAGLQESVRALEAENGSLREGATLATSAHEQLLAHHRDVVRQVVTEVLAVSSLSVLRVHQARQRLVALAELLRPEAASP